MVDGPDVEGLSPAEALAKLAEEPPTPSPVPFAVRTPRQFYGHTNAQHGVHPEPAPGPAYENPEVKDLYERLRRKFKEIGYEF